MLISPTNFHWFGRNEFVCLSGPGPFSLNKYVVFAHVLTFCFLFLSAEVKMPSGKIDLPVIEDNHDGTVRVQYDPKEEGLHELVLLHNGIPVQGLLSFDVALAI